jgi:hypothetical protein
MKTIFAKILCVALGLFFGVLAGELFLRIVKPHLLFYDMEVSGVHGHYMLVDNKNLIYVPRPYSGDFNSYGHRGREYPFKRNKLKRIVFLGDSVVEGLGIDAKNRFTDIVASDMNDSYEVINLGVSGYSLLQEFEYLKLKGIKFYPDYVLWGITYNDLYIDSWEISCFSKMLERTKRNSFYNEYYKTKSAVIRILSCSYVFRYGEYFLAKKSQERFEDSAYYKMPDNEVQGLLSRIRNFENKHKFHIKFVFLPLNTNADRSDMPRLKKALQAMGFYILDLDEEMLKTVPGNDISALFLPGDPCHLSCKGNELVAGMLMRHKNEILN